MRKPRNSCFCPFFFLFATVLFCSSCLSLDPYLGCGWCTTTESCLARSSKNIFSQRPIFFKGVQWFRNFQGSVPWWLASEGRPLSLRSLLHLHLAHQRTRHHPRHSASSLSHFLHKWALYETLLQKKGAQSKHANYDKLRQILINTIYQLLCSSNQLHLEHEKPNNDNVVPPPLAQSRPDLPLPLQVRLAKPLLRPPLHVQQPSQLADHHMHHGLVPLVLAGRQKRKLQGAITWGSRWGYFNQCGWWVAGAES